MAINKLDSAPVAPEFLQQVQVVQTLPKFEFNDGIETQVRNRAGLPGWVTDALAFTPDGIRSISWTSWGEQPGYSGLVSLKGVRVAPWATAIGANVRTKTGLWLAVEAVEPHTPSNRRT
jgi:hypothetical protein